MKRPGIDGGFLLCFGLNLLLNAFWALPAVVLLITHYALDTPLWLAWFALGLWLAIIFGITAFMSWATSSSNSNGAGTGTRGRATVRYSSQRRDERIDLSGKQAIPTRTPPSRNDSNSPK
ncbi:MAG: hypothetical protein J5818_05400 [Eggerthellaceae bacterium]|nr:hypothetical protein [Eggerthellaceae bacterium]